MIQVLIRIGLTIINSILIGGLGTYGGTFGNSYRKYPIPLIIFLLTYLNTKSWISIGVLSTFVALSQGYGIPSITTESWADEGSTLGRFFYNLFKHNELYSNIATRTTIGLILCLGLIFIPIIQKNWLIYLVCSIAIMTIYGLLSWKNLGTFDLYGHQFLVADALSYFIIGVFICILIYIKTI